MIDSVLLRQLISALPKTALSTFRRHGERAFFRDVDSDYSPTLFYYAAPDGKYYISVEVSLPKILFGSNVQMLGKTELTAALHAVGEFASRHFGVAFDPFTANVGRVDFCHNFAVGEDRIYSYLQAASEAEPAFLKRRIIGKIETVEFFNKSRKVYCYDKLRETERQFSKGKISKEAVEAARGILRLEARYNTTEAVKRLCANQLSLPDRQVRTLLNFEAAESVLTAALESLNLHEPVVMRDCRIEKLRQFYGYGSRLQRLVGFLQLCDVYGGDKLIALGVMKPSAYYKQRKEIRDAGALIFSSFYSTLPALSLR